MFVVLFLLNAVLPSAIVTMHSMKDRVIDALDMAQSKDSVTIFLADVPLETSLSSSDSKYKLVDLEKVCSVSNHCIKSFIMITSLKNRLPSIHTSHALHITTCIYIKKKLIEWFIFLLGYASLL